MELRPSVYQIKSNVLRVNLPTPASDSILDLTKFELSAASPGPSVCEPSILNVNFSDTGRTFLDLTLSQSLTTNAAGGYTLNIAGFTDLWGNYYLASSHNFSSVVNEEIAALGSWFIDFLNIYLKFDGPISDISSAVVTVDNSVDPPFSLNAASIVGNGIVLEVPSSWLPGDSFKITYSGISTASFNEISGSCLIQNNLPASPELNLTCINSYQVTSVKIIDIFPSLNYGALRVYFNGPCSLTSASDSSNYVFSQLDVHVADDSSSMFPIPTLVTETDLITSLLDFVTYLNGHLARSGVHYASSSILDVSEYVGVSDLLTKVWMSFNNHIADELAHSARDPVTVIIDPVVSADLTTNIDNAIYIFNQFNSHLFQNFVLNFKNVLTSSGNAPIETSYSSIDHTGDISSYHWFVDVFLELKSFRARLNYAISVANVEEASTTVPSDYSGSGFVLLNPSSGTELGSSSGRALISPPLLLEGTPSIVDQATYLNSLMRNYNLHLESHHKDLDVINVFSNSDLVGLTEDSILEGVSRFNSVLLSHAGSLEYHYSITSLPVLEDGTPVAQAREVIQRNMEIHVQIPSHHRFSFSGIIPYQYRSIYSVIPPLRPIDEVYSLYPVITLARRIGSSNDFNNEFYPITISDSSKRLASQICGVWFQDALRYSPTGLVLSKDVLNIYFTKPMNTSNLSNVVISATPTFSAVDRFWESDNVLSLVVPDLSDVSYSLTFTDLSDLAGNSVS